MIYAAQKQRARPWIPGVLLDGAVLLDRAALDGSGLVHGLHGLQRRLDVSLANMEALRNGPCGRASTASWLPRRHVFVLCVGLAWLFDLYIRNCISKSDIDRFSR